MFNARLRGTSTSYKIGRKMDVTEYHRTPFHLPAAEWGSVLLCFPLACPNTLEDYIYYIYMYYYI